MRRLVNRTTHIASRCHARAVIAMPVAAIASQRMNAIPSSSSMMHHTRSLSQSSVSSPLTSSSSLSLPSLPLFERARTGASSGSIAIQSLADNRHFTYSHLLRDAAVFSARLRAAFASTRSEKWSAPSPALANAEPRVVFLCDPSYEHVV